MEIHMQQDLRDCKKGETQILRSKGSRMHSVGRLWAKATRSE